MDYVTVEDVRDRTGLRLVLSQGVPGPWSVAAATMFDVKGIAYTPVPQAFGEANEALAKWTGHNSAPVAMYESERARAHWSEIIMLAERLSPHPPLIPDDQEERAAMFGLCHEMCAEDGLGWNLRLLILAMQDQDAPQFKALAAKYGPDHGLDHVRARISAVIAMLERRLDSQEALGSAYFVGDRLSAADIYWTAFSNLVCAMPEVMCQMPDFYRQIEKVCAPALNGPVPENLIAHRDRIARIYLKTPIDL